MNLGSRLSEATPKLRDFGHKESERPQLPALSTSQDRQGMKRDHVTYFPGLSISIQTDRFHFFFFFTFNFILVSGVQLRG